MSIAATQKSQKSMVGSPTSGSPPIPKCNGNGHASPPHTLSKTVTTLERSPQQRPPTSGRARHGVRNQSASGGVSVTLDGTGSWSDLADKSAPSPGHLRSKPSGMLGFLSKRKGRASSPKPQERGVLGREGARVVIA